jgi:hypothetical protein
MKKEFITCDGHLVYTMFGDRYTLEEGKHEVLSLPKVGGDPSESDAVKARRHAQMLKQSYPQKITLSVEYDKPEPAVEAPVEAAPEVPEAKPEAKPAPKAKAPAPKRSVKRGK